MGRVPRSRGARGAIARASILRLRGSSRRSHCVFGAFLPPGNSLNPRSFVFPLTIFVRSLYRIICRLNMEIDQASYCGRPWLLSVNLTNWSMECPRIHNFWRNEFTVLWRDDNNSRRGIPCCYRWWLDNNTSLRL
jgi:hypothetical protein